METQTRSYSPPEAMRPAEEQGTHRFNGSEIVEREAKEESARVVGGGSLLEAMGGMGGLVLVILGLAGVRTIPMASIAVIAVGAGLFFESWSITSRFAKLTHEVEGNPWTNAWEFGGGMIAGFAAGIAGIVLGILALTGPFNMTLLPVAAIALGAALLLGAGSTSRLGSLRIERDDSHRWQRQAVSSAVVAVAFVEALLGIGAVVLGILALAGICPVVLTLMGLLAATTAAALNGTALTGKMWRVSHA